LCPGRILRNYFFALQVRQMSHPGYQTGVTSCRAVDVRKLSLKVLSKRLREGDESNEGIAFVLEGSEVVVRGAVIGFVTSRWQTLFKIVRLYESIEDPKHLNNIGILQDAFSKGKRLNDYRHSSDPYIECLFRQPTGPEYNGEQGMTRHHRRRIVYALTSTYAESGEKPEPPRRLCRRRERRE
jgi:hypothetical protein